MCTGFTIDIGGKCVPGAVLVPSIVVPVLVLLGLVAWLIDRHKTKAARDVWTIHKSEMFFDEPYTVWACACICICMWYIECVSVCLMLACCVCVKVYMQHVCMYA